MAVQKMTHSEFNDGLRGDPSLLSNGIRARIVVAAGLKKQAAKRRATGQPVIASRLDQYSYRVSEGTFITKGLRDKLKKRNSRCPP